MGVVEDFFRGTVMLLRGLKLYGTNPRLILLGLLPALITGVVFIGLYVLLIIFADNLANAVTPFADDWSSFARETVRGFAEIAFLGSGALIAVLLFTAITLLIGDPFYEKISERVEERVGGYQAEFPELPWWRSLRRSIRRLAAADRAVRAVRHPAVRGRLHPGGRADRRTGDRRERRRLAARAGAGRRAVLPPRVRPAGAAGRAAQAARDGARLRHRRVRLLPHPARRGAAHAGRGRRRDAARPGGAGPPTPGRLRRFPDHQLRRQQHDRVDVFAPRPA